MATKKNTLLKASRVIDVLRSNARPIPKPTEKFQKYAAMLNELQIRKEKLEAELSEVKDSIAVLSKSDLPNAMLAMGVLDARNTGIVTLENGMKVIANTRVFVNCPVHKASELQDWLRTMGLGGLIKETVHPASLTTNVEKLIDEEKEDLIPDFISIYKQTEVKVKAPPVTKTRRTTKKEA